jgi:hypothetical protein
MRFFPKDRTSLTSAGVADKWNYLEALWVDRRVAVRDKLKKGSNFERENGEPARPEKDGSNRRSRMVL